MSADIQKVAVFDDRIVQSRPKYAVEKGALSLTNAPFSAISATASQHTYNIYVPSENVFVDRAINWSSTAFLQVVVDFAAVPPAGQPVLVFGKDTALRAFPLNSLCSTLTATINDTTSVINTQDVLDPVLRLADLHENHLVRTHPTMLDKYASYDDAYLQINSPLASYNEGGHSPEDVPNGAYPNVVFTNAGGAVIAPPVTDGVNSSFTVYIKFRSTERIVLSPFVFSDAHEYDTGLFGINNIQLVMNLRDPSRVLRSISQQNTLTTYPKKITSVSYYSTEPFSNSVVNVQFLTPSLDVPLPPKSVVPYMEFPRYISTFATTLASGATTQLQSQTITLPQIPDLLMIYAKPTKFSGAPAGVSPLSAQFGDVFLPPYSGSAEPSVGAQRPLRINFDNFSGLLSSHTAEQLYNMSVKNGLRMDWAQWSGHGRSNTGSVVATSGGFLVLKPSVDITLQSGQAPSLVGNFTLQFDLTVENTLPYTVSEVQLFVITANSGFFETIRGSSRIIKGVLSEQDIINAPVFADAPTRAGMKRLVGGGFMDSMANIVSKVKDVYEKTKPMVSMLKSALPEGAIKSGLSAVGYGASGGASGGRSGGRSKKMLDARLM